MPSAVSLIFALYLLVSIVAGIVSAVKKRSQTTTRGPRPAEVSGQPVQPASEFGFEDAEERRAQEGLRGETFRQPSSIERKGLSRRWREDELRSGSLEGPDTEGVSLEWADDLGVLEVDDAEQLSSAQLPAGRLSAEVSSESPPGVTPLSVRRFLSDRDQLRAMIVAVEVLGKPKGLTM